MKTKTEIIPFIIGLVLGCISVILLKELAERFFDSTLWVLIFLISILILATIFLIKFIDKMEIEDEEQGVNGNGK